MKIFYALFALYALAHVYIFVALRRAFGTGKWQIPVILFLLAMASTWLLRFGRVLGPIGERYQMVSFFWMGFLIFACYCLIVVDVASLLARITAFISQAQPLKALSGVLVAKRTVPFALCAALVLYAYAVYEGQNPQIREITITSSKLPADAAPLRIVGLTDVHISPIIGPYMLRRMAEKAGALKPDILILAGDLVDTDIAERDEDAAILNAIPARLGKFAVTGNHEFYHGPEKSVAYIRRCGFTVLRGEWHEAGGIVVAGVDDSSFARGRRNDLPPDVQALPETPGGKDTTDVLAALAGTPKDRFIFLVNHKPYYPAAAVGTFDLQYSGHTHSGQFWPGPLITRNIFKAEQGLSTLVSENGEAQSLLYISNGIGFWGPPMRFLAPPEISLITIVPETAE